ncbi:MAG: mandelate racemase/muconate lactonizing enzyme family protein [Frankiales bacterium]|nr:mandelate racemase/muconate lactonizing enzyme family protein [Frankiales bacterium]
MTITGINARAVRLPLRQPTRISTRVLSNRDYLLVSVEREGYSEPGIGYAYAGTGGGRLLADIVNQVLAPVLLGADADDIAGHWERMYQEALLIGRRGGVLRAISAVDIALWDLAGKRLGAPLAVLLGGAVRALPAYASGGYYRPEEGPWVDAVAREIAANQANGFTDHKIKVGGLTVAEDADRVRAAVEVMAGRGRLALDANNAYRSVPDALRALRAFERAAGDTGLWWFEEPLSPDDVVGHAQLTQRSETAIATGEIAATRWDFQDLLARGGAHVLQPDAGVLGGITEWMRVARAAETFGVPVAPHWHANLHAHLASATPGCITVEHFTLEKDIYTFEALVTPETRLATEGGQVVLSPRPGLGIELDEEMVRRHVV